MPTSSNANKSTKSDQPGRCQHLRADGKRCASANYPGHTSLCHHHLNREMGGIADGNIVAADILSSIGNFQSAAAINIALGKIFLHQVTGRISRQDALSLAYNCQLLLQTLPAVKAELKDTGYTKYWREETQRILSGPSDLDEITDPSLLPTGFQSLHPPDRTPTPSSTPHAVTPPSSTPASSTSVPVTPDPANPANATPPSAHSSSAGSAPA
jgi:hypothetical protein